MNMLMPVNFSAEQVAGWAPQEGDAQVPEAPPPDELANWEEEDYQLDVNAALSLGFPVASVGGNINSQVLIFGTSRWKDVSSNGHVYRFGVSLRVLVHVRDYTGSGGLTIPVVAAKVQIENAQATASLLVRGYKGDLQLPSWESFGVTAYSDYQREISTIQRQITSDTKNMQPQLLSTTASTALLPRASSGVGTVIALDAISRGETLEVALASLTKHTQDEGILASVRAVFTERVSDGGNPTANAKEQAREELHGIHLSYGWLLGRQG